jgi:NADP-dependent 3-hydroxy acid dehydrogenase YdfG
VVAELVARGDRIIAVARSADNLETLEKTFPGVRAEVADLTKSDEVEVMWQRIDEMETSPQYLVNAIGGFRPGSVLETKGRIIGSHSITIWGRPGRPAERPGDG